MRCPSCESEIIDPEAVYCPRCGSSLASAETEATTELDSASVAAPETTSELDDGSTSRLDQTHEKTSASMVADFAGSLRVGFVSGWLDATAAACLAFLVLLCVGAALLLAAKLQFPGFGAGANPIEVLTAIAILSLGVLRAPVHFGNLVITVLPVGALLAFGLGTGWACRLALRHGAGASTRERVLHGARVALPFALICLLASLAFRFRGGDEVFAGAWGSLFWGAVWGGSFGALAGLGGGRAWRRALIDRLAERTNAGALRLGAASAGVMLAAVAVLSTGALLLWAIVGLAKGTPAGGFGAGDAIAAIVYLIAFGPNVLTAIAGLGMGSAVDVGARVTVAGRRLGSIQELSLFSWDGDPAPWYLFLLMAIPSIATMLGGFYARRASNEGISLVPVLAWAAGIFATTLFAIALLGDARLGGGLVGRGVAHLSVHALRTLVTGLLWGAAGGYAGWKVGERGQTRSRAEA